MADHLVTHALTVMQPWAGAILYLGKDVENRDWPVPEKLIGRRIAIHAGLRVDREAGDLMHAHASTAQRAAIIGTVCVLGFVRADGTGHAGVMQYETCLRSLQSMWRRPESKCVWTLREPRALASPVPCKGALGLWRIPAHLLDAVNEGEEKPCSAGALEVPSMAQLRAWRMGEVQHG